MKTVCIWYKGYEPECLWCNLDLDEHIIPYTIQILVIDKWIDYESGTKDEMIETANDHIDNALVKKSDIRIRRANTSKLFLLEF